MAAARDDDIPTRRRATVRDPRPHSHSGKANSNRTAQPHRNLDRSPIGTDYILFHCVHRHPPTRSARLLIFSILENTVLCSQ